MDQLRARLNTFIQKRMVKDGRVPSPSELQGHIGSIRNRLGTPTMVPRPVDKNLQSNADRFNRTWNEAKFDLDLLFEQARKGAVEVIRNFQYNHVQLDGLVRQVHTIRRDIDSILLVHDRTTGMLENIKEDFADLSRIDTVNTTAEVDTRFRVVRLGSEGEGSKIYFGDASDVDIQVTVQETFEGKGVSEVEFKAMEGSSNESAMLNDLVNDYWGAIVTKDSDGPIEWAVDITLPAEVDLSRIQIDARSKNNFQIGLTTVNDENEEFFHGLNTTRETTEWRFSARKVRKARFLLKTWDATRTNELFQFYLIVVNISMYLDRTKTESDLYTEWIPLESTNKVGRLSIETESEGDIDWYADIRYEQTGSDSIIEESGWLPITPLDSAGQGDPVVLGSLTHIDAYEVDMESDNISSLSEDITDTDVMDGSLLLTTGVNLWRVDYHDVSLVHGRYITGPYAVDLDIAHTAFLELDQMPLSVDVDVMRLEMFHRFKFSTVLYRDPQTYTQETYDIRILMTVNEVDVIGRDDYPNIIFEVHSLEAVAGQVKGIDTVKVKLSRAYNSTLNAWEYSGSIIPRSGINYIVMYVDTGVKSPTFSESVYDQMKYLKCNLALSVYDGTNWRDFTYLQRQDGDFFMAGAETEADVKLYRIIVPHSKLSNKIAPDYDRASIRSTEYSTGSRTANVFLNHPYMRFPLTRIPVAAPEDPRRPESTTPMTTKCRIEYDKVERLVKDVRLWARLKHGSELPSINSFTLRFTL